MLPYETCAVCVKENPYDPNGWCQVRTFVGPLPACGEHVEEALRLVQMANEAVNGGA